VITLTVPVGRIFFHPKRCPQDEQRREEVRKRKVVQRVSHVPNRLIPERVWQWARMQQLAKI
jgi:hypothetical protein